MTYIKDMGRIMVKNENFVIIEYTGSFEDGEVFDSNVGREPLEFKVGANQVIKGLDQAVLGMAIDEEKEIGIEPVDAYGEYNEANIFSFPKQEDSADFKPEVGMTIAVQMQDGSQMPALIKSIAEKEIIVDMNHPLAGKKLFFKFKIVDINDEPQIMHSGCSTDGCSCEDEGCSC